MLPDSHSSIVQDNMTSETSINLKEGTLRDINDEIREKENLPAAIDYSLYMDDYSCESFLEVERQRPQSTLPIPQISEWVETKAVHIDSQVFSAKVLERWKGKANKNVHSQYSGNDSLYLEDSENTWFFKVKSPDLGVNYIEPLANVRKGNVWSIARELDLASGRRCKRKVYKPIEPVAKKKKKIVKKNREIVIKKTENTKSDIFKNKKCIDDYNNDNNSTCVISEPFVQIENNENLEIDRSSQSSNMLNDMKQHISFYEEDHSYQSSNFTENAGTPNNIYSNSHTAVDDINNYNASNNFISLKMSKDYVKNDDILDHDMNEITMEDMRDDELEQSGMDIDSENTCGNDRDSLSNDYINEESILELNNFAVIKQVDETPICSEASACIDDAKYTVYDTQDKYNIDSMISFNEENEFRDTHNMIDGSIRESLVEKLKSFPGRCSDATRASFTSERNSTIEDVAVTGCSSSGNKSNERVDDFLTIPFENENLFASGNYTNIEFDLEDNDILIECEKFKSQRSAAEVIDIPQSLIPNACSSFCRSFQKPILFLERFAQIFRNFI